MKRIIAILLMLMLTGTLCFIGCGTSNYLASYSKTTQEEKAKQALDKKNYQRAITLYNELIKANPTKYELYPLLSVALASLGGITVLDMVKAEIKSTSTTTSTTNLLASISGFVPSSPSDTQISFVQSAIATLQTIPVADRSITSSTVYSASAIFQLTLYLSASSLMVINKYKQVTTTGTLDPSKLATMSDNDVNSIINNLESVASMNPDSTAAQAVSAGATNVLAQIQNYPGDTVKDKLLAYISATQGATSK